MANKPISNSPAGYPAGIAAEVVAPTEADNALLPPPTSFLKHYLAGLTGISISLAVHVILLLMIGTITWVIINRPPPERDVGIVVGDEGGGGALAQKDAGISAIAGEGVELTTALPKSPEAGQAALHTELSNPLPDATGAATGGMKVSIDVSESGDGTGNIAGPKAGTAGGGAGGGLVVGDGAGTGGGAGGGTGGVGRFMGGQVQGSRFCYVLDCSDSMTTEDEGVAPGDSRLKHLVRELEKSINTLTPGQKFFIIFYDNAFYSMPAKDMVAATVDNKKKYIEWVREFTNRRGGGTIPAPAVIDAINLKPQVIWFLTDGEFEMNQAEFIRQANRGRCQINTFAFHSEEGKAVLQKIAKENRGDYRFIPPPKAVNP